MSTDRTLPHAMDTLLTSDRVHCITDPSQDQRHQKKRAPSAPMRQYRTI